MKKLLPVLLLFFTGIAAAQVSYDVKVDRDRVKVNTSALLSCSESSGSCPVNSWKLQWTVPERAEILRVEDSQGRITGYRRTGENLRIQTHSGPSRKTEKISITYLLERNASEINGNLYTRTISLPGFPGETTSGTIRVENLLSSTFSPGFQKSFRNNSVKFRGKGALTFHVNFGKGEIQGEYSFFRGTVENSSLAYRVAVGTTGLQQSYPLIPVAVLDSRRYNIEALNWSEGEYSAGVIYVRQGKGEDAAVLAEETVHAFNDEFFSFDRTSSAWLDEGIAGHVNSLVKRITGEHEARTLFGKDVSYTDRRNGSLYRIKKPSKGEREKLWQYYQNNRSFMKHWNPRQSRHRSFGYAYSELIVKNYISNNNTLKSLYQRLEPEKLDSDTEKWVYYSRYLDLTPCKFESRQRFEKCLEKVNSYNYPVFFAENLPENFSRQVKIQELEVPNYSSEKRFRNHKLFSQSFVSSIIEFLESLWSGL